MKKFIVIIVLGIVAAIIAISCADQDESLNEGDSYDLAIIEFFDSESDDWVGGIADYPDSLKDKLNFTITNRELDGVFAGDNNVLTISAKNPHKDLFYFITRKFTGLEPNAYYKISFTYEFLIEVMDDDKEGFQTELYLKAGGTLDKPDIRVEEDYYGPGANIVFLNYDKGEGTLNGASTIYFIDQIKSELNYLNPLLIQGETDNEMIVQTNSNGEFWGIFGIDSKNDRELAFSFNTILVFIKRV